MTVRRTIRVLLGLAMAGSLFGTVAGTVVARQRVAGTLP
jgi:hypothetical protein